ncbi:hypothetical protein P43SY_000877 [Pythium insidiosum]|uniref:Inositol polyphosphate-related phosphatase domain-containing protein n=1 Tax=Pythium insidiosum TaxID=114742 RepID=A0AAD5LK51_PYTIN|nr:hypothetical protein P43SY_000877 [Pythium insidiosum]
MDSFGFPDPAREKQDFVRPAEGDTECASEAVKGMSLPPPPSSASSSASKFYNPVVMSFIRDDWIQQQLHLRQSEFTTLQKMTVLTGTWNVNAKKPLLPVESNKLLAWLQRGSANDPLPDIVALGFQEIVDLNAVNVMVNNMSSQRASQWEEAILTALNQHMSQNQYRVVLSKTLVGILLVICVKVDHIDHVRDVCGATAGVGIMGMMGNKGGAVIRMSFYDSTICFVCAHLAAHRENVAGRNADYMNILSKIDFKDSNEYPSNDMRRAGTFSIR